MMENKNRIILDLVGGFLRAKKTEEPYPYWFMTNCLPPTLLDEVLKLPFAAANLEGLSGKRELHNDSRRYFDVEGRSLYPCMEAISNAFQDDHVTSSIEEVFGCDLDRTYLRVEFAQDVDGFWLEPHTDIGVKKFTFLLYLSKDSFQADLGTDVYDSNKKWVGRTPYQSNCGMIFVPSTITYHGFEKRPINGVRKLLVINYVTDEWRAREQLAFPDRMVRSAVPAAL